MDLLTVVACLLVFALSGLMVGLARYATRQTSFEDSLPGYNKVAADVTASKTQRTASKANRKKSTKQQSTEEKSAADGAIKARKNKSDEGPETETEGYDEPSDDHANRKQKKKPNQQRLKDEDLDLLSYSKNFKSALVASTKKASALSAQAAVRKPNPRTPAVAASAAAPAQNSSAAKGAGMPTYPSTSGTSQSASATTTTTQRGQMTSSAVSGGAAVRNAGSGAVAVGGKPTTTIQSKPSSKPTTSPSVLGSNDAKLPAGSRGVGPEVSADWETKTLKGDPLSILKKQLEEKEQALRDAFGQIQSLTNRYNETRAELSSTRDRNSLLEKQCQQIHKSSSAEIDALKNRMQHSHTEHVTALRSVQTAPSSDTTSLAAGKPDDGAAQQKLKILDDALKQNVLLYNTSENARKTLEVKLKKNEEYTKNLEQKHKALEEVHAKKVETLSEDLMKLEARNRSLLHDLDEVKKVKTTDSHHQEQKQQIADLEAKLRAVEPECDRLKKIVEAKDALIDNDEGELDQMKEKLQAEVDHYKRVLLDTEQMLKELQGKTESTEHEWKQKMEAASLHRVASENEIKRLQDEINAIRNNNESVLVNGSSSNHEHEHAIQ